MIGGEKVTHTEAGKIITLVRFEVSYYDILMRTEGKT